MLGLATLLLAGDPIAEIDALAKARNVDGIAKYASESLVKEDAFRFLKRGGAYGVGTYPWGAQALASPDGSEQYVVFKTRLTAEDLGEQVFAFDGNQMTAWLHEADDRGYRVARWDLDVRFDTPSKQAKIVAVTRFEGRADARRDFFVRLGPEFKVTSLTDESGKPVAYHQASGVLSVAGSPGRAFTYRFEYSGTVDQPGYAGAITAEEATLTNDYWYPMVARNPAPFSVTVHVAPKWEVVAQGERVADKTAGAERTVTYRMDVPVTYLSLTAGELKVAERKVHGRTYRVWTRAMADRDMARQVEMIAPVIEFYDRTFAPFPFSGYGDVVSRLYSGGALEAYSFATYSPGWLPANEGHEPSHTWFGGMLDNTYLKSFWNESFADWSDGYYHRFSPLGRVAETRLAMVPTPSPDDAYQQATCEDSGVEKGPVASSLGYGKGAAVLLQMESDFPSMLDWVRKWVRERPAGRGSEWEDFERVCGPQTKWFFDQWVRRKGWPRFEVRNVRYESGKLKGEVAFQSEPYRLTTDLLLRTNSKDRWATLTLNPSLTQVSSFEVICPNKPDLVALDPWDKLLIDRKGPAPARLQGFFDRSKIALSERDADLGELWKRVVATSNFSHALPAALDGWTVIGDFGGSERIRSLVARAGVRVRGEKAVWDGTSVDLRQQSLSVLVDLPDGGRCAVLLGRFLVAPEYGHARLAINDAYGRLLRAKTDPRITGPLAFKLN